MPAELLTWRSINSVGRDKPLAVVFTGHFLREFEGKPVSISDPSWEGPDGTRWVRDHIPVVAPSERASVKRRKRALRAKVTYTCEAASEKSGLSAAHHAGVPESVFRKWQKKRNFVYWPPTDVAAAVDELMAMDGYRRVNPRDEDLLRSIVDAAELGYKLYRLAALAHGIAHPG